MRTAHLFAALVRMQPQFAGLRKLAAGSTNRNISHKRLLFAYAHVRMRRSPRDHCATVAMITRRKREYAERVRACVRACAR